MTAGHQIPPLAPGSPEWLRVMSASKVAAVLGLSPYESRFSLWHKMSGAIEPETDKPEFARGHYLEDGIAQWWASQEPTAHLPLLTGGTWMRDGWMVASPDRLVTGADGNVIACLEVKSSAIEDGWGKCGTDEIPPGYRAQVMWQMDVTGLRVAHVAALLPFLDLRSYVIEYDQAEADDIRAQCRAFMDSLPGGPAEQRPDLDGATATYEAVRQLHPDIDRDMDVELDRDLADRYCRALAAFKAAETEKRAATTAVADAMSDARKGTHDGITIATRQAKAGGTPFLKAGNKLPTSIGAAA